MLINLKIKKERKEDIDKNKVSFIPDANECYILEAEFEDGDVKYFERALKTIKDAMSVFKKYVDVLEKKEILSSEAASKVREKLKKIDLSKTLVVGSSAIIAISTTMGTSINIYLAKKKEGGEIGYKDKRYIVDSERILRDRKPGLTWKLGPDVDMNWKEARRWINSISAVTKLKWRMPLRNELRTFLQSEKKLYWDIEILTRFFSGSRVWYNGLTYMRRPSNLVVLKTAFGFRGNHTKQTRKQVVRADKKKGMRVIAVTKKII